MSLKDNNILLKTLKEINFNENEQEQEIMKKITSLFETSFLELNFNEEYITEKKNIR